MTGFGGTLFDLGAKKVGIEIKSLNGKQTDITIRIPAVYREKELELRNELAARLVRGKIDMTITVESTTPAAAVLINAPVVENYYMQLQAIADKLHLSGRIDFPGPILSLPESVKTEQPVLNGDEWMRVRDGFVKTVELLDEFRSREGAALKAELETGAQAILLLLNQVEPFEKLRIEKIKTRIRENLDETVGMANVDANRFEQELIYYIEKLDVSEEKSRLKNHIDYFLETLDENEAVGKKLGFIAQEMGREINTLGSKANEADMQKLVIKMKDELEKIKEQVLNVL
jgi:uncharacterized protein (TIGR00255 family)